MSSTLSPAHRENSFDLLRLAAALGVVIYHSFSLSGHAEPLQSATSASFGNLAVLVFFVTSGFLVTRSLLGDPRPRPYLIKRGLRLLPALFVCSFLTAFVLGPLVSGFSLSSYFGGGAPIAYWLKTSVLFTFNGELPGVFVHNVLANTVNGSLWTLPLEATLYLALLCAGLLGLVSRRPWVLLVVLAGAIAILFLGAPIDAAAKTKPQGADVFLYALRPCTGFLMGSVCVLYGRYIPRRLPLALLALALYFTPLPGSLHAALTPLLVAYAVFVVGPMNPGRLRALVAPGDLSYGIYIYAYPLQQTVVQLIPGISPLALLAIVMPPVYLLGFASWRLIEKPALELKRRFAPPPARAPDPELQPTFAAS